MSERVRIDDPAHVQAQYVTEENLETRRSVWHPTADGRDPTTEALDAIVADNPLRVLEIGPGTGMFAVRLAAALPHASVTTIDQSERFVEMTRARGVDSRVGDDRVQGLGGRVPAVGRRVPDRSSCLEVLLGDVLGLDVRRVVDPHCFTHLISSCSRCRGPRRAGPR